MCDLPHTTYCFNIVDCPRKLNIASTIIIFIGLVIFALVIFGATVLSTSILFYCPIKKVKSSLIPNFILFEHILFANYWFKTLVHVIQNVNYFMKPKICIHLVKHSLFLNVCFLFDKK